MTPANLNSVWSRRFYMAIALLSFVVIALYVVAQLGLYTLPSTLTITFIGVIGAAVVFVAAVVLAATSDRLTSPVARSALYIAFIVTTAYILYEAGGPQSPLLFIWVLAAFLAPLLGGLGWISTIAIAGAYLAKLYLDNSATPELTLTVFLVTLIPLAIGAIAWHELPDEEDTTATRDAKNLANKLSEVANKSEIVINAIGDGVIAIDSKGIIQLINPAAQEILGWGKQDALMLNYKSILKLVDQNDTELSDAADPLQQVLNTNQQHRNNKLTALTQSGKKIGIALVVSPIGDAGSGAIAVFRDSTSERAEEREQAEFISTASHEMRTPVASIEGYLGLAMNPSTATIDARAHDFINKAHESAQHLGRLFQDLLDVSKSEDGRMASTPRVVDIVNFAETITQGLTQKAAEKGLELIFKPTNTGTQRKIMPVYYVNLDNDHIREVLDNLIENAIKYTRQGTVTVDVDGQDDAVTISVKDTGLGIPSEDVSHLFQKFYRVSNMDRQDIGGTGLGLYLSRRLVESMQGRLWVESVFGEGSTFYISLPRIDSVSAEQLKAQQEAQLQQQLAQRTPSPLPVAVQPQTPPVATVSPAPAPQQQPAPQPQPQPVAAPQIAVAPQPVQAPQVPIQAPVQPQVLPQPQRPVQMPARPMQDIVPQPAAQLGANGVRPASTVPRGESLSREQIAARVQQLEQLAAQQRAAGQGRQ